MPSTPPATNTSPSSALIARAAALIAARPEAQSRLNVTPATETGKPARRAAIRATFRLSSPAWFAQPRYTSSTGEDRGPDRGAYLHLEVRFIAGTVPIRAPLGPGNLYPPTALRRRVRLEERPFGGFARGRLSVGCRQCTDGSKMVLFVTGLCSFHCFYCPVSDEKMYKDVVFADEKRVLRDEDVLDEAHAIRATGAGITGGDPLDAVERTCRYIRLMKEEFGPDFHTHLYTMSTDEDKIRALADAGLDEIRFHVPPGLWSRAAASALVPASRLARSLGLT